MEIDKYLDELNKDLNNQLTNLGMKGISCSMPSSQNKKRCPFCNEELLADADFCPYCGNELSNTQSDSETNHEVPLHAIYKLHRYEELESETKSKIGTFEKIYKQLYEQKTGKVLIGKFGSDYEKLDFASLVNLLSSAIEIELKASVLNFMRREYGECYAFKYRGMDVDLGKKHFSLRDYLNCLYYDLDNKSAIEKYGLKFYRIWGSLKVLKKIIPIRNKADHTENIGEQIFFDFYDDVYTFFEEYVKELIHLKNNVKHNSNSFKVENETLYRIHSDFSWNEATFGNELSEEDKSYLASLEDDENEVNNLSERKGVILTNTQLIARKFLDKNTINLDGESVESGKLVRYYLEEYVKAMSLAGIDYTLLDLSDNVGCADYSYLKTWQDYARITNVYANKLVENGDDKTLGLFIIGGDDIIPVPRVENPFYLTSTEDEKTESERILESDMLYAYYDEALEELTFKNNVVNYSALLKQKPRYWVGRLPLENGLVDDSFDNFINYFKRAVEGYIHLSRDENDVVQVNYLGIDARKHIATACESAKLIASRVLQGIPLQPQDKRVGFIQDRVFVSPGLDLRADGSRKDDYKQATSEADMINFILNGASMHSFYHYYGETKDKKGHGYYAFMPELLDGSNVKIVSGICCWGARYVGYSRMQSTLLQAMYGNVLLFMGSCRSACGTFDIHVEEYGCDIALAETLLKYYLNYLLQGYDAGEALGRAKILQLTHPDCEDINMVLGTILEFNLYGDPLLSLVPQIERNPIEIIGSKDSLEDYPFRKLEPCEMLYDRKQEEHLSLLERLRRKVDNNLQDIREKVNKQLYANFGIEPRSLSAIYSYQTMSGNKEYRFCYSEDSELYDNYTFVNVDEKGKINRIVGSI